ncbi:MAG: hypothetical protein KY447_08395 [Actinobacteria bacterium]|nr:hypothetical protein [Actinomycetota bacterium]
MLYTRFPEFVVVAYLATQLRGRLAAAKADERGMTTETVVITSLLVLLAIGAMGVLANKVMTKANSIQLQ